MSLDDIINQHGTPKAIINCPEKKTKKIIFNFDETIYLNHKGILIVNGKEKKSLATAERVNLLRKRREAPSRPTLSPTEMR